MKKKSKKRLLLTIGDESRFNNGPVSDEEIEAGRAQSSCRLFTLCNLNNPKPGCILLLIPLAFSVGLLLGYYISYVNL